MMPRYIRYGAFSMDDLQTASFVTPDIISRLFYCLQFKLKVFNISLFQLVRKKIKNSNENFKIKVTEVCIQASKILGTRNLPWPVCNFSSNSFCCLQQRQLVPSIQSDLSGRKETVNKLLIGLNCLKICPAGKTSYIYDNSNETRDAPGDPRLTWAEIRTKKQSKCRIR